MTISTALAFEAQVRVGEVDHLRSFGFELSWNPAVLRLGDGRERIDTWLVSSGGQVIPLVNEIDAAAGKFRVIASVGGAGTSVSTLQSEAIYRLPFSFVGTPADTSVSLAFPSNQYGLVRDGSERIANVELRPLTVDVP